MSKVLISNRLYSLAIILFLFQLLVPDVLSHPTKITPELKTLLDKNQRVTVIISMRDDNDPIIALFQGRTSFSSRTERINALAHSLHEFASNSQRNVINFIQQQNHDGIKSLWTTNQIIVWNMEASSILQLSNLEDVSRIEGDFTIPISRPIQLESASIKREEIPWVWATGIRGQGTLVANIDTGVNGNHESLADNYLGTNGWFDPIDLTEFPTDNNGHGTHTMGTMAGTTGNIGVAPGTKWMACRGCLEDGCELSNLLQCAEWLICPNDFKGTKPNCSFAPDVINHSWSGGNGDYFKKSVACYHAAGIVPVFIIGNQGRGGCETTESPGNYPNVIAVGATERSSSVSSFSGREPAPDKLLKPDLSAPGSAVLSASHSCNSEYAYSSGTSMAAPHVAGLVALTLSKNPRLDYDQVKDALFAGCVQTQSQGETCGRISDKIFPNHIAGHGRIDAGKTISYIEKFAQGV